MTKAFAYLRVSGKGQLDGDGFTRQREAIIAHGLEITDYFEERGLSGDTDWQDRTAWCSLLRAVEESPDVKTIIIEKLDRLARDLMVQETIIADLKKRGIALVSTMEPDLLSNEPTRILLRQLMGAIAQYDKAMIVAKLSGARRRIRATGARCEGRKPYGTRNGEERTTVEVMQEYRAEGMTYDQIADELNGMGSYTHSNKPWRGSTVNRILARTHAGARGSNLKSLEKT